MTMWPIIEGPPDENDPRPPLRSRLIWFVALWVGGLVAVAVVAYTLRALIL
jgi:hypothetical protein